VTKPTLETASFDEELELEQQRAASYRSTADRYRQLLDEATTPEHTQYFSEMIARSELNVLLRFVPTRLNAEMAATAINAAISAYSIAVTPD
jgi:hypothetical protein